MDILGAVLLIGVPLIPVQGVFLFIVWCVRIPGAKLPEGVLPLRGKWVQLFLTGIISLGPPLWIISQAQEIMEVLKSM